MSATSNPIVSLCVVTVLGNAATSLVSAVRPVYKDVPFRQDVSIRYKNRPDISKLTLRTVRADRDGKVLVNTDKGLLWAFDDELAVFNQYAPLLDRDHRDIELLEGKFVFLTDNMFLPLHGAGRDYRHNTEGYSRMGVGGAGHYVLLSQDKITEIKKGKSIRCPNDGFTEIYALADNTTFVLFNKNRIGLYKNNSVLTSPPFDGQIRGITALDDKTIAVATAKGLFTLSLAGRSIQKHKAVLPLDDLTCIDRDGAGRLWIGSTNGAFCLNPDGKISYYAGRRWLQDNHVLDVHVAPNDDVYILNKGGLAKIQFTMMTLADKAAHYQKRLRHRFIRYGFVSDVSLPGADPANTRLHDSDNDGLWTGMYLAAECFRYAVTKADDALANAMDAFDALERTESINPLGGFQARTFELHGFKVSDKDRWRQRPEKDWEWKGTTSSDEIVGTFFAHAVVYETIGKDFPKVAKRVATLVGKITDHIVDHDLYIIDADGKPTRWSRWNPEYVNSGKVGGDRRLNSIEILAFLQLAYKLTDREKFKKEFYKVVKEYGYAENTINYLPSSALGFWNHSDDELYWLSYYNLLKWTFDDSIKRTFLQSVDEHYKATQRKKNPVWNQIYAAVTDRDADLEGPMFILREFPLDMQNWRMVNSHRKDVKKIRRGLGRWRVHEAVTVLPPDERRFSKWNGNEMALDGGGNGHSAESGAEFLLPYWMGRYYGFISPPQ